jgi:hypothetical protein
MSNINASYEQFLNNVTAFNPGHDAQNASLSVVNEFETSIFTCTQWFFTVGLLMFAVLLAIIVLLLVVRFAKTRNLNVINTIIGICNQVNHFRRYPKTLLLLYFACWVLFIVGGVQNLLPLLNSFAKTRVLATEAILVASLVGFALFTLVAFICRDAEWETFGDLECPVDQVPYDCFSIGSTIIDWFNGGGNPGAQTVAGGEFELGVVGQRVVLHPHNNAQQPPAAQLLAPPAAVDLSRQ